MPQLFSMLTTAPATAAPENNSMLDSILLLLIMAAVIIAAYFVTRMIAGGAMRMQRGSNMRVVDRLALTRDKAVMVVEIAGNYYVLGVSGNAVNLICTIDAEAYGSSHLEKTASGQSFREALTKAAPQQKRMRAAEDELERMAERMRKRHQAFTGKEDGNDTPR